MLQTPRVIRVSLGDHSWMDKKYKFVTVSKIVVHPDFVITPDYMGWDYAILTLTKPVQFSHKIQPICLPESDLHIADDQIGLSSRFLTSKEAKILTYHKCYNWSGEKLFKNYGISIQR